MRASSINKIKEGSVLGKSIYSSDGRLLLSKGISLDKNLLHVLRKHQIVYVYIEDKISKDIEIHSIIDDKVRVEAITNMKKIFHKAMYHGKGKEKVDWVPLQARFQVENIINDILESLKNNEGVLYNITELMGTDMHTYNHSVNVAVLAILTARTLGFCENDIKEIGLGSLLHDLGKIKLESEILNKEDFLNKEEANLMKKHVDYGYEMVKDDLSISYIVKQIIYSHHEYLDGSGYPRGLKGKELLDYSKIVTICDEFDTMTSVKHGKKKMSTYEALELLSSKTLEKLDANILSKFIENIAVYPIGTGVVLEDGRKGIVVDIHRTYPTRPIVRIIEDKTNKDYYEIDLMKNLTIFIKDVIDLDSLHDEILDC